MDKWLMEHLACPRDKQRLELRQEDLYCPSGHKYPVISGFPVMLVDDADSTHGYINETLEFVRRIRHSAVEVQNVFSDEPETDGIDPFVQNEVPLTSGTLYFSVQNRLTRYPIPHTRLSPGNGERLLDVGCNWGRWTIAAANRGYRPIGIDPSIKAVAAARRVAKQLKVDAGFIVGDARFLPFSDDCFDTVFSYGVYQHLTKENTKICLRENSRVLKSGGISLVQMPNRYGIRQYQQHRRRGFTEGEGFDVRYWTPTEILTTFEQTFGKSELTADCYFGLGIQAADVDLFPAKYKAVVYASEILRRSAGLFRPLRMVADSVYVESVNDKSSIKNTE